MKATVSEMVKDLIQWRELYDRWRCEAIREGDDPGDFDRRILALDYAIEALTEVF